MYSERSLRTVAFILLAFSGIAAQVQDIFNFQSDQQNIRCIGIQCPPERPVCVIDGHITKCVPRPNAGRQIPNSNRLSRAPRFFSDNSPFLGSPGGGSNLFGSTTTTDSTTTPVAITSTVPNLTTQPVTRSQNLNQNNLRTAEQSVSQGNPTVINGVPGGCFLPSETGRCRGYFPKYFYNARTGECETFTYGGCGGNENQFNSFQQCVQACALPVALNKRLNQGGNPSGQNNIDRRNNNMQVRAESGFASLQNGNPGFSGFAPGAPPPPPRACILPASRGPCLNINERYFYNTATKRCELFNYGGCGGNENNFGSLQQCRDTCDYYDRYVNEQRNVNLGQSSNVQPSVDQSQQNKRPTVPTRSNGFAPGAPPPPPRDCLIRPDPGPCFGFMQRFYYNTKTKQCETFEYGGCAGNGNNFQTLAQCRQTCDYFDDFVAAQKNIDLSQNGPGSTGGFPTATNGGRGTSSVTTPNIEKNPKNQVPPACTMKPKTGPCRAAFRRYFYNPSSGTCEQFIYGGCQPNANNFMSQADCQKICGGVKSTNQSNQPTRNSGNLFNNGFDGSLFNPNQRNSPFRNLFSQSGNLNSFGNQFASLFQPMNVRT